MINLHDPLVTYCPLLGGEIPFRYCRTANENLPCRRTLSCWELRVNIEQFLRDNYSVDQLDRAFSPPTKTRIETILELVEKAKKQRDEAE